MDRNNTAELPVVELLGTENRATDPGQLEALLLPLEPVNKQQEMSESGLKQHPTRPIAFRCSAAFQSQGCPLDFAKAMGRKGTATLPAGIQ